MKKETSLISKLQKKFENSRLKKKWQSIGGAFLIVALFICASILFNNADLSLKDVVFGYGGGYIPPSVSASLSTVEASPTSVTADGTSTSTITVTVKNTSGGVMSGKTVSVSSDLGTVTPSSATTDSDGQATFTITSSATGDATISATVDGTTITDTATVSFTAVEEEETPPEEETPSEEETTSSQISEGDLIRAIGDYKVYIVKGIYKRWIQTADIFGCYGHLNFDAVQNVSTSTRDSYTDAWLIRADGDTKVYEVNGDMTKHWLNMTVEEFAATGRSWDMVYIVNSCELSLYTTGPDVCYRP